MVFQDPLASLDPRRTVGSSVGEPLRVFRALPRREIARRVEELLAEVGLDPRWEFRYPHELSGGQRQRIGIARALALDPALVVCDEPVSALDVSVQAQVINLLLEAKERRGLSYLFIAHDLALVRRISTRVAVLLGGRIVEEGPAAAVLGRPAHPYTRSLAAAAAAAGRWVERSSGRTLPCPAPSIPRPEVGPRALRGCPFAPRCPEALPACAREDPPLAAVPGEPGRRAACLLLGAGPHRA